jgi:SAM-dependent methyltransferase
MKIIGRLSSILSLPTMYRLFTRIVAGDVWRVYLADYVKPVAGEKVLDIGCGPADILSYLPEVDYTGLDISSEYIAAAKQRFGDRGRFWCGDVGLAALEREQGTFTLVLATGVLHHLDDERASKLYELARLALRPNGRLITYDGCYVPEQSKAVRVGCSAAIEGSFVRSREEDLRLASSRFARVESHLRHGLLRIPCTRLILSCSDE